MLSAPAVLLLCHLRLSVSSHGAPDPGCWFLMLGLEQISECVSPRCHSSECAAGLQQQECGLGCKGEGEGADQNGSPSIFYHVCIIFFKSCKLAVVVFFDFPFRPQQLERQNVILLFFFWQRLSLYPRSCKYAGLAYGGADSIHPSICSALNSAVRTFPGHVHGSQRTTSSIAVVPESTRSLCSHEGKNSKM